MIKCPNGHLIPDDSKFCPDCGAPVKNEQEIRDKARHIAITYKNGYDHYVTLGILPHFSIRLTIENCEKIISMEGSIKFMDKEINDRKYREGRKERASRIVDNYHKGYEYFAQNGVIPYYSMDSSTHEEIIAYEQRIIQKQHEIEANEPKYETIHYVDGSEYVGHTLQGKRQGYGTYTFADGSRYYGEWKNDKRHGKGNETYTNGDRYEGDFFNDHKQGYGIYYYKSGQELDGKWYNDEYQQVNSTGGDTSNNDSNGWVWLVGVVIVAVIALIVFAISTKNSQVEPYDSSKPYMMLDDTTAVYKDKAGNLYIKMDWGDTIHIE